MSPNSFTIGISNDKTLEVRRVLKVPATTGSADGI